MGLQLNTEQWIEKAKIVHGDKYDYRRVEYIRYHDPIIIICKTHDAFEQRASDHLSGKGCPNCIGRGRDTNGYIKEAKAIHKNHYDYSRVKFEKMKNKIEIICPIHGVFFQTAQKHLSGHGCKECGKEKSSKTRREKYNIDNFIAESICIHGEKYDYSKSVYTKKHSKIIIVCPSHGEFPIPAISHLSGQGCGKCALEQRGEGDRISSSEYFQRAIQAHGEKYEYDLSSYKGMTKDIRYKCLTHGWQSQQAQSHIKGSGCPRCGEENRRTTWKDISSKRFWVSIKAQNIHIKYDLSKFVYVDVFLKSIAICNKHGEFPISPDNLKRGKGCPRCKESKGEAIIANWLDKNTIKYDKEISSQLLFADNLMISNIGRTRFDFVLRQHKLIIEYDGQQHFEPVFFGGTAKAELAYKTHIKTVKSDELKDELAASSGYHLVRIPYWEKENIPKILSELFQKNRRISKGIIKKYSRQQNQLYFECEILGVVQDASDEYF